MAHFQKCKVHFLELHYHTIHFQILQLMMSRLFFGISQTYIIQVPRFSLYATIHVTRFSLYAKLSTLHCHACTQGSWCYINRYDLATRLTVSLLVWEYWIDYGLLVSESICWSTLCNRYLHILNIISKWVKRYHVSFLLCLVYFETFSPVPPELAADFSSWEHSFSGVPGRHSPSLSSA